MLIEKASQYAQNGGAGTAFVSGSAGAAMAGKEHLIWGLTTDEWSVLGVIGGLLVGLIGLVLNTYFQWKRSVR
jgi:hypothetical protein